MSKSLSQYRDQVRELRSLGVEGFSARDGYKLTGSLSTGQKAAITHAFNRFESGPDYETRDEFREPDYFLDAAGDDDEEWEDIDWLDYREAEDFEDEENDQYEEDAG